MEPSICITIVSWADIHQRFRETALRVPWANLFRGLSWLLAAGGCIEVREHAYSKSPPLSESLCNKRKWRRAAFQVIHASVILLTVRMAVKDVSSIFYDYKYILKQTGSSCINF